MYPFRNTVAVTATAGSLVCVAQKPHRQPAWPSPWRSPRTAPSPPWRPRRQCGETLERTGLRRGPRGPPRRHFSGSPALRQPALEGCSSETI